MTNNRCYNFAAGPAMLPESVLKQAQAELLNYQGLGCSVMEISHRSATFENIVETAKQNLRDLLSIPQQYDILLLTAPARSQFAMIPMNCLRDKSCAAYFDTGIWSQAAITEAARYTDVKIVTSSEQTNYTDIALSQFWIIDPEAAYVHYTDNESINGVEFQDIPDTGDIPLMSDMTSNLMTRVFDVSRYGLVYAGVQKNLGPAGLTVVIIRSDLIGQAAPFTPRIDNYQTLRDSQSLEYTPATFTYYMFHLMLEWIKAQGGVAAIEAKNLRNAQRLYECIDNSDFYINRIVHNARSRVNIPFQLRDGSLDTGFLEQAKEAGLISLKGHRRLGGMRASLYNAMPEEGVIALTDFMQSFEQKYG